MSYTVQLDMSGVPGADFTGKKDFQLTATVREQMIPLGNGKAKVKLTLSDMRMSAPSALGQNQPKVPQTQTMIVDQFNRIAFEKGKSFATGALQGLMSANQYPFGMSGAFPQKAVRYGDSWPVNLSGGVFGSSNFATAQATYLGRESFEGMPCNRTQISVDMDFAKLMAAASRQMPPGAADNMKGYVSVTGYNLTSQSDGDIVSTYASGQGSFDFAVQNQRLKMALTFSVDMKRLR